jgi:hypothetical protein
VTGANGCTDQKSQLITVNNTPPSFTVCIVQPTLCANSGSVTFNATGGSGFAYSIDNGNTYQTNSNTFTGLASGSVTGYKVKNSFGCISSADCNTTSQCDQKLSTTSINTSEQSIELLSKQSPQVKAFPNPFNDRIRFTLKSNVSGQGSLELYNTLGQKVKTVFQGYVNANQLQTIEYAVPGSQRSNLIYVFRVGNEQTTGKLIGLK